MSVLLKSAVRQTFLSVRFYQRTSEHTLSIQGKVSIPDQPCVETHQRQEFASVICLWLFCSCDLRVVRVPEFSLTVL